MQKPGRKKALEKSKSLSKEIKDLFSKMLVYDSEKRIDFIQIYEHPVFD